MTEFKTPPGPSCGSRSGSSGGRGCRTGSFDVSGQKREPLIVGAKVTICHVTPNGKQHNITISENAVAAFLRTHPRDFLGSCGAFRPQGAKRNVCVRLGPGRFVAVWVPTRKVPAYLRRNYRSYRTSTGTC